MIWCDSFMDYVESDKDYLAGKSIIDEKREQQLLLFDNNIVDYQESFVRSNPIVVQVNKRYWFFLLVMLIIVMQYSLLLFVYFLVYLQPNKRFVIAINNFYEADLELFLFTLTFFVALFFILYQGYLAIDSRKIRIAWLSIILGAFVVLITTSFLFYLLNNGYL